MSHYSTYDTCIKDQNLLVQSLVEMGFDRENIEVHDMPVHLYGYQGDRRKQVANVVIRREHVGNSSNDLGFLRKEDGTFEAIISEYDRRSLKYNEGWLNQLNQKYAVTAYTEKLRAKGFKVFSKKEKDGRVHIDMRRN